MVAGFLLSGSVPKEMSHARTSQTGGVLQVRRSGPAEKGSSNGGAPGPPHALWAVGENHLRVGVGLAFPARWLCG